MIPWETARLTPFEALQLIVASRDGWEVASGLEEYSQVYWLAAARRGGNFFETIRSAFQKADEDLTSWWRRGLIRGDGSVVDVDGHPRREDLTQHQSNRRSFDYERGAIRGYASLPYISDVLLDRDSVLASLGDEALPNSAAAQDMRSSERAVAETPLERPVSRAPRGAKPTYDWTAMETAFLVRVEEHGWPENPLNEDGWRSQADVERWIVTTLHGKPGESTARREAVKLLEKHRPTKAHK